MPAEAGGVSGAGREGRWDIVGLLKWTAGYFESHGIDSPRMTAELLLSHALGITRLQLYLRHDQPLCAGELAAFKTLIRRRARREPTAYILGQREFWSREFQVDPGVLIPRPETEHVVEAALGLLPERPGRERMRLLDLGTGSGAIVVTLAAERPGHRYVASDIRPEALRVARANAGRHRVAEAILFFCGSWFHPLKKGGAPFDIVVSNPPYIARGDVPDLQPEVSGYEPITALDGGPEGFDAISEILAQAPDYTRKGGALIFEMGHGQADRVRESVAADHRYREIRLVRDLAGIERVAVVRLKDET